MPSLSGSTIIKIGRMRRELAALAALIAVLLVMASVSRGFYAPGNIADLFVATAPTLIVAAGMTLVIVAGHIDISVGSHFAVCSVLAGVLAKAGLPMWLVVVAVLIAGTIMGGINGTVVGRFKMPAIVVTLAAMVIWRDGLRWLTEGAWVQDLPAGFQWMGLSQTTGQLIIVVTSLVVTGVFGWYLKNISGGREIFATGSDPEAARLAGINPNRVVLHVYCLLGALTGLAAVLNAVRFNSVPGNAGIGLEMKVIAAAVVGGATITGGRATMSGTLIGTILLGTIGTALTFAGISPFWEKAFQGAIILLALCSDLLIDRMEKASAH